MKNLFCFVLMIGLFSCGNENSGSEIDTDMVTNTASAKGKSNEPLPEIRFEEEVYDFGKITEGEKVSHAFTFTNTGKANLIITGANASCGCTVPEFTKEPVPPGGTGKINVVFSSEGKSGLQEKTITVVTNCEPATRVIRIKTDIIVAETAK